MAPQGYEERRFALPDGEAAALVRPGRGGTVLFAHANGLNAGAYGPFLEALRTRRTVVALDLRGHGRTHLPAEPGALRDWTVYAGDLAAVAGEAEGPLVLAGHSLGAVSSLIAAGEAGAEAVLLIEPVMIPRAARLAARTPLRGPVIAKRGIAARAARRRTEWPEAEAVAASYARNPFFAAWDEAALSGYLERGLTGKGPVRLACEPAWEAATFAAQGHRVWAPLRRLLTRGVPVHVLKAEGGSTVPGWAGRRLASSGAALTLMPGEHLLPQERPREAASWMDGVLRSPPPAGV